MERAFLTGGERMIALSAGLLVILSRFRPWARYTVEGFGAKDGQVATALTGPTGFIDSADFEGLEDAIEATGGIELHKGRGIMLFIGLILAAVMTYGGYLHGKQEQEDAGAPADTT